MFCCTLLYVNSSIAIILMEKRELVALPNLSSWCLVMVERLFLSMPRGCLRFVIVVFPDHTHLLFLLLFIHCMCGFCVKSLFCCAVLCVFPALIRVSTGKRELVALALLSSWCHVAVVILCLFFAVL